MYSITNSTSLSRCTPKISTMLGCDSLYKKKKIGFHTQTVAFKRHLAILNNAKVAVVHIHDT